MTSFLKWVHQWLGVIVLLIVVAAAAWYQHQREVETREARSDVCHLVEANDNGLIHAVTPAPSPAARAETQGRLDTWASFVDDNSGVFHCRLHFLPAP